MAKGVHTARAAFKPIAAAMVEVATPGPTSADLSTFDYRHRRRSLFPFEPSATLLGVPGWRDLSVHSFRHTAIALALDADVPFRDVQTFAGHKSPRTTRRYDHSVPAWTGTPLPSKSSRLARRS